MDIFVKYPVEQFQYWWYINNKRNQTICIFYMGYIVDFFGTQAINK